MCSLFGEKVKQYHIETKLTLPQNYIELCATHLVAGNPLEPLTTTPQMETFMGELG